MQEGATQCQQSGPTGWGCCIPIDNFFPCTGIPTCELDICDVKEVALQSFRAMYLFVSTQAIRHYLRVYQGSTRVVSPRSIHLIAENAFPPEI